MATDLAGSTALQTMKANILLVFAMNNGKAMSPAESMSLLRIPAGHYGPLTWRQAVQELITEGVIEIRYWGSKANGWRVPALVVTDNALLPYAEAAKFMTAKDYKTRESSHYPRVFLPASRTQYSTMAEAA